MNNCNECNQCNDCNPCNKVYGCTSIVDTSCINYTGEDTACINIEKGDKLETIIHKLAEGYCALQSTLNDFNPLDGVDGVDGADGIDGINGTNGVDGVDGVDGKEITNITEDPSNPDNILVIFNDSSTISYINPSEKHIKSVDFTNAFSPVANTIGSPIILNSVILPSNFFVTDNTKVVVDVVQLLTKPIGSSMTADSYFTINGTIVPYGNISNFTYLSAGDIHKIKGNLVIVRKDATSLYVKLNFTTVEEDGTVTSPVSSSVTMPGYDTTLPITIAIWGGVNTSNTSIINESLILERYKF